VLDDTWDGLRVLPRRLGDLLRRVDEDDHAAVKLRGLREGEVRCGVDVGKKVLTPADRHGREEEMKLIDQSVLHERGVKRTVPVLQEILSGLPL